MKDTEEKEVVKLLLSLSPDEIRALKKMARSYIRETTAEADYEMLCESAVRKLTELCEKDKYVDRSVVSTIIDSITGKSSLPCLFPVMKGNKYTFDKIGEIDELKVEATEAVFLSLYTVTLRTV